MSFSVTLLNGPYQHKDKRWYCLVQYNNGRRKYTAYARYKMERKLRRKLKSWEEVDHRNENKSDDRMSNLQVLSHKANTRKTARLNPERYKDSARTRWAKSKAARKFNSLRVRGEKAPLAKLTDDDVIKMRKQFRKGELIPAEAARERNVSLSSITNALKGITFKHLPRPISAKAIMKNRDTTPGRKR